MKSEIKITLKVPLPPSARQASHLEDGTAFTGRIGTHESIFLKHFTGVVDLMNPRKTWDGNAPINDFRQVNLEIIVTA